MDSSISDLMKKFSNMMDDFSDNNSSTSSSLDFDTIMKIKGFMEQINNKNNPDSNLLSSLKPYLKESRKNKVDTYISLLNMSKAMNLFGNFRW